MDEYKSRLSAYLSDMVREELEKYDGGFTDEWNDQRKKNAEVLGYKLSGKSDIKEGATEFWQDMFRPGNIPNQYINQLIKKKGELPSKSHIKKIYRDNGNPSSSQLSKAFKQLAKEKYIKKQGSLWKWESGFAWRTGTELESVNEKRIKNSPLRRNITSTFKDLDKKFRKKLTSSDIDNVASHITSKNRYFPKDLANVAAEYFYAYKRRKLKINQAIQATINYQRGYPYKTYRTGTELESVNETKKRDYKAEYKKYGSSTKAKKYRAELNKYNRQKGTYGNGDGKDASHKGGKIVGFEKESTNRGRAEKSRLKKEITVKEGNFKISKRDANKYNKLAQKGNPVGLDLDIRPGWLSWEDGDYKTQSIIGDDENGREHEIRFSDVVRVNESMNEQKLRKVIRDILNEGKPKIYSLPTRKQDIIYKMLWHRNQPKWHTPGEFEQFIKKYFNNYLPPHIADGLKKTKSAEDFVKFVRKFDFKESVNEATEFIAIYNRKKIIVKGDSLYDAKLQAIKQLKVPKSKQGYLSIMSKKGYDDQQFRYENINEAKVPKNIKISKQGYVKQVRHPMTNKILKAIYVKGNKYQYNSVYKTYNSVRGNQLLYKTDIEGIKYENINEGISQGDIKVIDTHDIPSFKETKHSYELVYVIKPRVLGRGGGTLATVRFLAKGKYGGRIVDIPLDALKKSDKFEKYKVRFKGDILPRFKKFIKDDEVLESINEANPSQIKKALLKQFGKDPLYKDVIMAKNTKEMKKAMDTLKSIRGGNAIVLMQKYANKLMGVKDKTANQAGSYKSMYRKIQGESINEVMGLEKESTESKLRNMIKEEIQKLNEGVWPVKGKGGSTNYDAQNLEKAFKKAGVKVYKVKWYGPYEYFVDVEAVDGRTTIAIEINQISNVVFMNDQRGDLKLGELREVPRELIKNLKAMKNRPGFGQSSLRRK